MVNLPKSSTIKRSAKSYLEMLLAELIELDPNRRGKVLRELSENIDLFQDLAPLLWYSFGTIAALLQEIVSIYQVLSTLKPKQSERVCNALALLQCLASHPETRMLFLNANIPLYLYPFLHTTSNEWPYLHLRLASLDVIDALVEDMLELNQLDKLFAKGLPNVHHVNYDTMVLSYMKGPLLFIFNFHPTNSYGSYCIGVEEAGEYIMILNTDEKKYGGRGILSSEQYLQRSIRKSIDDLEDCLQVPLPSRTFQVYRLSRVLRTILSEEIHHFY